MIKSKSYEKLDDANIQRVIDFLEAETPITKKEACEMLNIKYNTTRLQRIIDEFNDTKLYRDTRKAQNKGKMATKDEIKTVVQEYLEGTNISTIARGIYRSPSFVKNIVERVGIPQKLAETDYAGHKMALLPDQCVSEEFEVGERVWFPRKNRFAEIRYEITQLHQSQNRGYACYGNIAKCVNYEDKYGARCYNLYVFDPVSQSDLDKSYFPHLNANRVGFYSNALAYELGSLRHLQQYL